MLRVLLFMLMPLLATAEGFQYEEGTHYVKLEVPIKTRNPDKVEVTEYFSYGCPHCYQLEPIMQQWTSNLPDDVEFNRSPAVWRQGAYELYARTYYTAKALGILEEIHTPLFQAIHSERRRLTDLKSMANFMSEHGVDPTAFIKAFNDSFGVKAQYQQAIARQRVYRATGVPALIINGKYRVETTMVESRAGLLQVAGYLIERERSLLNGGETEQGSGTD